jgi:hypothetical protein
MVCLMAARFLMRFFNVQNRFGGMATIKHYILIKNKAFYIIGALHKLIMEG